MPLLRLKYHKDYFTVEPGPPQWHVMFTMCTLTLCAKVCVTHQCCDGQKVWESLFHSAQPRTHAHTPATETNGSGTNQPRGTQSLLQSFWWLSCPRISYFTETKMSLLCSQQPATWPHPESSTHKTQSSRKWGTSRKVRRRTHDIRVTTKAFALPILYFGRDV